MRENRIERRIGWIWELIRRAMWIKVRGVDGQREKIALKLLKMMILIVDKLQIHITPFDAIILLYRRINSIEEILLNIK